MKTFISSRCADHKSALADLLAFMEVGGVSGEISAAIPTEAFRTVKCHKRMRFPYTNFDLIPLKSSATRGSFIEEAYHQADPRYEENAII